jgi:hypothetical protein
VHELGVIPDRSLGGRGILAFQKIGDVLEGGAVTGGRPAGRDRPGRRIDRGQANLRRVRKFVTATNVQRRGGA